MVFVKIIRRLSLELGDCSLEGKKIVSLWRPYCYMGENPKNRNYATWQQCRLDLLVAEAGCLQPRAAAAVDKSGLGEDCL